MLEEMPADLFRYWQAFDRLKPFGHADRLLALIAAKLYNAEVSSLIPVALTDEEYRQQQMERALAKAAEKNQRTDR
jgi:hypothetical protein